MWNYFLPAVYSMIPLFLITALGFFLVRLKKIGPAFIRSLSYFLINVALPCWLFTKLIRTGRENLFSSLLFPGAAFFIIALGFLLGIITFFLWRVRDKQRAAGWAMAGLGNSGYLPLAISSSLPMALPAIAPFLPEETAALYIGMYLVIMNPLLWTFGNYLVAGDLGKPRFGDLLTPPAISVLVGVLVVLLDGSRFWNDTFSPFYYLINTLETLGAMTLPTVLICLGGSIGQTSLEGFKSGGKQLRFTAAVMTVRLLLMPGFFFLLYAVFRRFFDLQPVQYWVLFLEMVTPPATNLAVMAIRAEKNEGLVAETLLFSYLGYFLLFPFYLALFLSLPLFH